MSLKQTSSASIQENEYKTETTVESFSRYIRTGTRQIWSQKVPGTQMEKFQHLIQDKYGVKFSNYWDLHKWSTENYPRFWEELWCFYDVIYSEPYTQTVKKKKNGGNILDVEWFPGARLNYAENILRYRDDGIAFLCINEDGDEERVTYGQLFDEVKLYAAALRKQGLEKGDTVACYISNRKEAFFVMLAATSIGAIFGGPHPNFGAKVSSIIMKDLAPKFLFTVASFKESGIEINMLQKLSEVANACESIEKVIIIPTQAGKTANDLSSIHKSCYLEEFLAWGRLKDGSVPELVFQQLPLDHPIFLNFSSGTTGTSKGFLHSAAAFLTCYKDFGLHLNYNRDTVMFSRYPPGWTTWNIYANMLGLGICILLYDGCPWSVSKTHFWNILDRYKVTVSFLVPSVLDTFEKNEMLPEKGSTFPYLKVIILGGCPVKFRNVDFILKNIKSDVYIAPVYACSEVMGLISGFDLNSPAYSSIIQCASLAVDVQIFNDKGESVVGEAGELVITNPMPSFPVRLWNDVNRKQMSHNYLSKYPGVWAHNDEACIDPNTKGIIVIGRRDNVIKQFGGRFVAEEIYLAIHDIEEIIDYICVPQYTLHDEEKAVLFVRMREGQSFNQNIARKIQEKVKSEFNRLYVPQIVRPVSDIPYNLNGKRMENVVKKIINTNQIPQVDNIRNPECLQQYCNISELVCASNGYEK